jgi:hypothetical protein
MQEQYNEKRKQYMDGEITHQEFYRWVGNSSGLTVNSLSARILEMLPNSTDEHLNDIPLKLWDALDFSIRQRAAWSGMKSWSMSDSVCVAKCLASEIKG